MLCYRAIYKNILTHTDPERAHHVAMRAIGIFGRSSFARLARLTVGRMPRRPMPGLLRRPLPGRVGLAAGQDKNATAVEGLRSLGFAFVEIGTVTLEPQPGNEQPRLWRIPEDDALRNRMGFNNDGAEVVASRLAELRSHRDGKEIILGVNIGKNKWVSAEDAPADYARCAQLLGPYADYLVINVSSPNTPGLRDLQNVNHLRDIARAVKEQAPSVPTFVKIAPDLADEDIREVAQMVLEEDLAGVVATNTTINHTLGEGGLSGMPLRARSLEVVRIARNALGPDKVIIGVGGIFTSEDAHAMLAAGADLIEILTSFISEGPLLPGMLNRSLA